MTMPVVKSLPHITDTISFKSISTGGQSAGNGGDGSFKGSISNQPTIKFDPSNKASGAEVKVTTGDHVSQKAYWDADAGNAKAFKFSKAYGGDAKSNEIRAQAAAMIPPRCTPIRRPSRRITSLRTNIRKWWPALAATAETATSRWVATSNLALADPWRVRLAATGGTCRRSYWRSSSRRLSDYLPSKVEAQISGGEDNADAAAPLTRRIVAPATVAGGTLGLRRLPRTRVRL